MKKLMAMVMAVMLVMGISVGAFAYNNDPTGYGYNNGYGYYNYGYNNNGYGYTNYGYGYNCSGIRTTFSDKDYNPSAWFETYAEEYGVVFHVIPTMPISRSDVFAPVGKAMDRAHERVGRNFSNSYGVNFIDFTWDSSLYAIAGGLYQRGIMIGYPEDNTVRFPQNITRAELAKVLVLTANQNGIGNAYGTINHQFADMEGHWASQYASQCHALGLMVGKSNYAFAPNDYVTYEEYVTVMLRMAERTGYSNYSINVEDVAYGITTTMDIDFEDYEYSSGDFELDTYSSSTVYMNVGDTKMLKVKATIDLEDENQDIEWEASKNNYLRFSNDDISGKYATVDIKALKEGKITVKAMSEDDSSIYAKFTIVISDGEYDSDSYIKVNPSELELEVGQTKTITATVYPTSANYDIIWESHNTSVATVNQNGKITAVGVGNTTITATSEEDEDIVATIEVTVTAGESSDSVSPVVELTGADSIDIGKMATLTVKVDEDNLDSFEITESDILGLTGGASINKIKKVSNDTYEITLMGVEVSSMALCIDAGVAVDAAGNRSTESNEVIVFINSGE